MMSGITSCMYQGGSNMAECITFGRIAGKNAAEAKEDLPAYVVPVSVESSPAAPGQIRFFSYELWSEKSLDNMRRWLYWMSAFSYAAYDEENAKRSMESFGMESPCSDYNNDLIGNTIGRKDLSDGRTLILVVIRGSSGTTEWLSNFNLLETTTMDGTSLHSGFWKAASTVYTSLYFYLNDNWGKFGRSYWFTENEGDIEINPATHELSVYLDFFRKEYPLDVYKSRAGLNIDRMNKVLNLGSGILGKSPVNIMITDESGDNVLSLVDGEVNLYDPSAEDKQDERPSLM